MLDNALYNIFLRHVICKSVLEHDGWTFLKLLYRHWLKNAEKNASWIYRNNNILFMKTE